LYFPNPAVLILYFCVVYFFLYIEILAEDPSVASAGYSRVGRLKDQLVR
jgi:hypothetical protein